jgi:hypothetical protein
MKEISAVIGKKSMLKKLNFWIANKKTLVVNFFRIDGERKLIGK